MDINEDMKRYFPPEPEKKDFPDGCVYNREGVACTLRVKPCYKCGWNPTVSKARICKIKEQFRKESEDVR